MLYNAKIYYRWNLLHIPRCARQFIFYILFYLYIYPYSKLNLAASVMSKQNYDSKYIKYGFTSIEHKAEILPQCEVCLKTLCTGAIKPSLLKRHLERNHPNKMNADKSYFQLLADSVNVWIKRAKCSTKVLMLLRLLLRLLF